MKPKFYLTKEADAGAPADDASIALRLLPSLEEMTIHQATNTRIEVSWKESTAPGHYPHEPFFSTESGKEKEVSSVQEHHGPNELQWLMEDGDNLARSCATMTKNGGLMILGPYDKMRVEAEKYEDREGFFCVYTHGRAHDFHMHFYNDLPVRYGEKKYGVDQLAELISEHVKPGQPVRLFGCDTGTEHGIAKDLARRLPNNPLWAPNGFCQLADGQVTISSRRPSETGEPLNDRTFELVRP